MIALVFALSLTPLAPDPGPAPASPPLPPPSVEREGATRAQLVQLHDLFDQSCGQRAYGRFDQVCAALSDQIRSVEREAERAAKRPHVTIDSPPTP